MLSIIVFCLPRIALFLYGFTKQQNDAELSLLNSLGNSVYISRGAGLVLCLDAALLILLACKSSLTSVRTLLGSSRRHLFLRWIIHEMDNHVKWHVWTAMSMLLFTLIHVNAHYFNFYNVQAKIPSLGLSSVDLHYKTFAGITGHVMVLCMFLIYTTAHSSVRTECYETFTRNHGLYLVFYLAYFIHPLGCFVKSNVTGACKGYHSLYFVLPPFLLYMCERLLRCYRSHLPTSCLSLVHHKETLELIFEKPSMRYVPGQHILINVPLLSKHQWHPFTLTSTPEQGFHSIHIRSCKPGSWTHELIQKTRGMNPQDLQIKVDGPFGAPAQDVYQYDHVCLVSTGIGVTPSVSILKSVLSRIGRSSLSIQKLVFVWVNRDLDAFEWFPDLLKEVQESLMDRFQVYTFFTGPMDAGQVKNVMDLEETAGWLNSVTSPRGFASNSVKITLDPVTKLYTKSFYGRPAWNRLLLDIRFGLIDKSRPIRVGVFFCGPDSVLNLLKRDVSELNSGSDGIVFDLIHEHF